MLNLPTGLAPLKRCESEQAGVKGRSWESQRSMSVFFRLNSRNFRFFVVIKTY